MPLAEQAAEGDADEAEVACDTAHDAVEMVADAILATPIASVADIATKAGLLLARGDAPADLSHYGPDDLVRFLREVCSFAGR